MLPPWSILRRPGWTLFRALVHLGFRGRVNAFLRRERLAPVRSVLDDVVLSPRLNLVPTSPCLFPPPPDWAGRTLVTGCVSVPEAGEPAPFSVALQAFLASGLPPVFLSLGSSEQIDPARAGSLLVEAARTCGRRAIVQLKSRRVVEDRQEGDVLFVGRVRHASLFPRCAVVVHHGGAGTTQTVALAGVPSVVVPFVDEQRWWGRRLQRAGAACAPLCYASATAPRLAAAIRDALDNAALADGSQRLGRALRSEDGVTVTVRALERLVEGSRRG
jgi:sterol 3beta-glucosyltransferase/vancomycin aglycone glucosyltransferase